MARDGALFIFFFNDTATTEIYTLSLHDALPISRSTSATCWEIRAGRPRGPLLFLTGDFICIRRCRRDRKSTRLNSSHANISYAVFCLKKEGQHHPRPVLGAAAHRSEVSCRPHVA